MPGLPECQREISPTVPEFVAADQPDEIKGMMGLLMDALEKQGASYPVSKESTVLNPFMEPESMKA